MRVRGVFVALGDSQASSGSSNEDAAFDLAQNRREQLVEGKDFDSLTVDTQTHPGSSVADSFDVWVSERDLEDEDVSLREAILTLPDGEISEPIFDQNRRGFYLFQVPERTLGPASSGQYVRLYDPDNRLIAEDSNHLRYIGIPDSGTYTLLVSGNEGDYGLYLEQLDNMAEGAKGRLSRGDVITDTISMVGGDRWTFSGAEGNNVLIAMSSVELDTYLELYDPTSGLIAQDDDGGGAENSRIAATLPISGTYTVVATGYGGYERGSYSLSLKAVEGDH